MIAAGDRVRGPPARKDNKPMKTLRWTSPDLDLFPNDGKRYEIIAGELYVSKHPHWQHQVVCGRVFLQVQLWSDQSQAGMANLAPGLIFADDEDVVPDVIWISHHRLQTALWLDGKLHTSPELVVEVLSPGGAKTRRDRELKLKLYSRRGADEYWIVNWQERRVEVYRRQEGILALEGTLTESDTLRSPLLAGFAGPVSQFFAGLPRP
jgi:Uma2 family endonuclease